MAHPRVAILGNTLKTAMSGMRHFFMLFVFIFLILGFLAHWTFGTAARENFGTFYGTCMRQFKMIIGDWPFDDQSVVDNSMSATFVFFFGVYFLSYAVIVFFTLVNFFIAIIVEA